MVYDPVRDCDVPSPAVELRRPAWENSPSSASAAGHPLPPAFSNLPSRDSLPSPGNHPLPSPSIRSQSGSGSLRGLLNDDPTYVDRRGSDFTNVSSNYDDEHQPQSAPHSASGRPNLSMLLNEPSHPPLTRSVSGSSSHHPFHDPSSPRLSSPSAALHPGVSRGSISRSPLMAHSGLASSPVSAASALPPYDAYQQMTPGGSYGPGPSSRRSSTSFETPYRPMMPPAEPIRHPGDYFSSNSSSNNSSSVNIIHRSPSVSVSPRSQHLVLPPVGGPSRPSSSRSQSTSAHPLVQSTHATSSPESVSRRLSEERQVTPQPVRAPSGGSINGRPRRGTLTSTSAPLPPRQLKPYAPHEPPKSREYGRAINVDEIQHLRAQAHKNNPLRRMVTTRPQAPSWSAPSPRGTPDQLGSQSRGPSRRGSEAAAPEHVPDRAALHGAGAASGGDQRKRTSDVADLSNEERASQRPRTTYTGNAAAVASHYNMRAEVGVEQREFSPIIGLKKFNNWVKSVLIGKFAYRRRGEPGAKVLDIGCGKGGDLNKWRQARIELYVGMDIAATSIDQARERWETMRGNRFEAFFVAHDCYSRPISEVLPESLQRRDLYDNVSMQFCMHYAFETPAKARMMIENVSRYLRKGGVFIGTIPNSELLLSRLSECPDEGPFEFGNSCYSIAFKEKHHKGVYGHEYQFYLQDAVEDVPEYVVLWDNFVDLAFEYGLEPIYTKAFNEVLQDEQSSRDFGPLLTKMGVVDEHGESAMDADQWEAANIYMAFAFRKTR